MDAITNDPGYRGGVYDTPFDVREGLVQHGLFWSVMGPSTQWWKQECWRPPGFVDAYFSVLDPNSLLARGWKWRRGDVSRHTGGDFSAALGRIMAKTLVMPISEDTFFPRDCAAEQTLIPRQRAARHRGHRRALGPLQKFNRPSWSRWTGTSTSSSVRPSEPLRGPRSRRVPDL